MIVQGFSNGQCRFTRREERQRRRGGQKRNWNLTGLSPRKTNLPTHSTNELGGTCGDCNEFRSDAATGTYL